MTQEAFLADLDKDVVNFVRILMRQAKSRKCCRKNPNLLVNGSDGIAVGMATSIPPHNLGEVIDAVKAYMADSSLTSEQLLEYVKGPDFPTGGIVINKMNLKKFILPVREK